MLTFASLVKACPVVSARPPSGRFSLMASVCDICGKKPSFGMSVSHSHRRTKRRWDPNIQRVRALVNGGVRRLRVCTRCLRSNKVVKAA